MNQRIKEKIEAAKLRKMYKAINNSIFSLPLRDADVINRTGTITREDSEATMLISGSGKTIKVAETIERYITLKKVRALGFKSIQDYVAFKVRNPEAKDSQIKIFPKERADRWKR